MKRGLFLLLCMFCVQLMLGDNSPNNRPYEVKVGVLYFNKINIGTDRNPIYVYELVDADEIENLEIPDNVENLPVTRIAANAFKGRWDIQKVVLNPSMDWIGSEAFANCKWLTDFDMTSTTALKLDSRIFNGCGRIEEFCIPSGLKTTNWSFDGCSGVKAIEFMGIPDNVVRFLDYTELKSVKLCDGMTETPVLAGALSLESVSIPSSVTVISVDAFSGCKQLQGVEIPVGSKLTSIKANAFNGTAITAMDIPDNVFEIGSNAFGNTSIKEIRLPEALKREIKITHTNGYVETINNNLNNIFTGCSNLSRIIYNSKEQVLDMPPSVYEYSGLGVILKKEDKNINLYVGDEPLTELDIPDFYEFPNQAFAFVGLLRKVKIGKNTHSPRYVFTFANCYDLEEVYMGDGDPDLQQTFYKCKNLKKVDFSSKAYIENLHQTFAYCSSLEEVRMPYVTTAYGAFLDCSALRQVELPEVETLDSESFRNCVSLEVCEFPKLKSIGYSSFKNCDRLRIFSAHECNTIDRGCFSDCINLEKLEIGRIESIPAEAFKNCEKLPSFDFLSVKDIDNDAFANSGLEEVCLGDGVSCRDFGKAFKDCKRLRKFECTVSDKCNISLSMPALEECTLRGEIRSCYLNAVSEEGAYIKIDASIDEFALYCAPVNKLEFVSGVPRSMTFSDVSDVKSLFFPTLEDYLRVEFFRGKTPGRYKEEASIDFYFGGNLAETLEIGEGMAIPDYAFAGANVKALVFTEGEEPITIGEGAFACCTNLEEVEMLGNVISIGTNAFQRIGISSIVMSESVKSVGMSCFQQDGNLQYAVLSPSIDYVASGMFHNCQQLESVVIPEGVKSLGDRLITYEWNKAVNLISLPSTLDKLYMGGDMCSFANIPTTIEIYSWSSIPPGMGKPNFDNNVVHVPVGSAEKYLSDRMWMNANIVEDLRVEETISKKESDIIFTIPLNTELSSELVPVNVEVVINSRNEYNEVTEIGRWVMSSDDESGIPSHMEISVGELEDGDYTYSIAGYAEKGYKTYMRTGKFNPAEISGINTISIYDSIRLEGHTLIMPYDCIGKLLTILHPDGKVLMSVAVDESADVELNYPSGIYIINIGGKSYKISL